MATTPTRSGHLPINDLSLYHEVYGDLGRSATSPLLLLPGAFMATGSMASWVSAFAGGRPVIVVDQQGHGRTPDTSRPMSYEQFADDAAAFEAYVEKMKVLGFEDHEMSDAQVSSLAARTMVVIGDADAVRPGHALAMFELRGGGDQTLAPMVSAFLDDTTDPG